MNKKYYLWGCISLCVNAPLHVVLFAMTLKYVKKIKGAAGKNGVKNCICKQGLRPFCVAIDNPVWLLS